MADFLDRDKCKGCKYEAYDFDDFPCDSCKRIAILTSDGYKIRLDQWEPMHEQKAETETDVVNHPSHYTQGGIECIDAMKSAFGADELAVYCKIAAFKYIWRCELKNGSEDVKKAIWYLQKFLELETDNGT